MGVEHVAAGSSALDGEVEDGAFYPVWYDCAFSVLVEEFWVFCQSQEGVVVHEFSEFFGRHVPLFLPDRLEGPIHCFKVDRVGHDFCNVAHGVLMEHFALSSSEIFCVSSSQSLLALLSFQVSSVSLSGRLPVS